MRHGLKMLMEPKLNRRIQADFDEAGNAVLGHDSAEDARAAGELVRLRISEEWAKMQRQGWTVADGVFVPLARQALAVLAYSRKDSWRRRKRSWKREPRQKMVRGHTSHSRKPSLEPL